jgi:DNA-binding Lrp family transcriptional regulator
VWLGGPGSTQRPGDTDAVVPARTPRVTHAIVCDKEVVEFRRMYGRPDCFVRVAVADHAAYEAFLMNKLSGLPAVLRLESHLTMKEIKPRP